METDEKRERRLSFGVTYRSEQERQDKKRQWINDQRGESQPGQCSVVCHPKEGNRWRRKVSVCLLQGGQREFAPRDSLGISYQEVLGDLENLSFSRM